MQLKDKYLRIKRWTKGKLFAKVKNDALDQEDLNICMFWSVHQFWYDLFQLVIEHGANINYHNSKLKGTKNDDNILTYICRRLKKIHNPDIIFEWITTIIKLGVNINHIDTNGKSALIISAEKGCFLGVMLLVKKGCDVEIIDSRGYRAFDVFKRKENLGYYLAMHVYMALNCTRDEWLALQLKNRDWESALAELEYGPPENPDSLIWKTTGNWKCFSKLVEYGADLTQTSNGQTLLDDSLGIVNNYYFDEGSLETALEIMRRGMIPINPERFFYPLIEICKRNDEFRQQSIINGMQEEYNYLFDFTEVAIEIMHFGADPGAEQVNKNMIFYGEYCIQSTCCAPIYYACKNNNKRLVRLLLIYGATVDYDLLDHHDRSFFEPYRDLIEDVQKSVVWNDWEYDLWPKHAQETAVATMMVSKKSTDMMDLPPELLFMIIKKAV